VHVHWSDKTVFRIRFSHFGQESPVPPSIPLYLNGKLKVIDLETIATEGSGTYPRIYREVMRVPYGETATYGEIAGKAGTVPRIAGMAMARNPTPLIVPCHRIVGKKTLGGFTPSLDLKIALLNLEQLHRG
jgi:methylated-DNA-[protein]-cysteine S-methyltransferase